MGKWNKTCRYLIFVQSFNNIIGMEKAATANNYDNWKFREYSERSLRKSTLGVWGRETIARNISCMLISLIYLSSVNSCNCYKMYIAQDTSQNEEFFTERQTKIHTKRRKGWIVENILWKVAILYYNMKFILKFPHRTLL